MAEFLVNTGHILSKIEEVVQRAKEYIYLISPGFARIPEPVLTHIWEAQGRNVKVFIVYRDAHLQPENGLELISKRKYLMFNYSSLNTNAYFNEKDIVLSSFRLFQPDTHNGTEFGSYFRKAYAADVHEKLLTEARVMTRDGIKMVFEEGQLESLEAVEARRPPVEVYVPEVIPASSKKLSVKEKQKFIQELFARECPDCTVKIEGEDRLRLYGKGIVLTITKERVDIIFVQYDAFHARMEEVKEFLKQKHPDIKSSFQYNRINLGIETQNEIIAVFPTIRHAVSSFSLIQV